MAKLIALLRVKDGILFVNEWVKVMTELVDEIVVVDNGSTDGTYEILKANPKVVDIVQTFGFDEGRDKILVYEMARKRKPDWCIWLDVDEIFEKRLNRKELEKLMSTTVYNKYVFRRYDFIKDYHHFFLQYFNFAHCFDYTRSLWREQTSGYFHNYKIHNGDIQGITGRKKRSNFRIKHFGYVDKKYVERKTNLYIDVDPDRKEDYLNHFAKIPGIILKWYEYEDKPILVKFQLFFYNSIYYLYAPVLLYKKVKRIISSH